MMREPKLGNPLARWVLAGIFFWCVMPETVVFANEASIRPTVKGEAEKAARIVKDHAKQRKEEFQRHIRQQFEEFDARLRELKEKGSELREVTRVQLLARLDKLKEQKEQILPQIEQAIRSTEVAWEDIKNGINRAVKELKISLEEAASNFY